MPSCRRLRMIWTSLRMLARCRFQSPDQTSTRVRTGSSTRTVAGRADPSDGPRSHAASSSSRDQDACPPEVRNDENR